MTPVERLIKRLRDESVLDLPSDTIVKRTYVGHWQRSSGALTWFFYSPTEAWVSKYGSTLSVTELLKHKKLIKIDFKYAVEILPENY